MNIESQNSTQMEISESNNQPSLSSLLLSSKVFNDDIYDIFKNTNNQMNSIFFNEKQTELNGIKLIILSLITIHENYLSHSIYLLFILYYIFY